MRAGAMRRSARPSRTTSSATRLPNASSPANTGCPMAAITIPRRIGRTTAALGKALTERARSALQAAVTKTPLGGAPLPDGLIPAPVFAVAVTLYHRGVAGCFLTWNGSLDACVVRAATRALSDARFIERNKGKSIADLAIAVSVLHDREWLGETTLGKAAAKLRMGADTMSVQQGDRRGFLLASVGPHFNWGKERFAQELLRKAGVDKPPYTWCTYQTATWLETPQGVRKIASGFPERGLKPQGPEQWKASMALLGGYIARNIGANGLPEYAYLPVTGQRAVQGSPARLIHALAALDEAGQALGKPDVARDRGPGPGLLHAQARRAQRQAHAQPGEAGAGPRWRIARCSSPPRAPKCLKR